ncbi:hypothetical protein F4778DRAFT_595213 [Xylariomycetidae sp. FL2044]|nr:hypothetical protein F4778DRAFT_595213 [Xylariomycetidae sp. FL2044]
MAQVSVTALGWLYIIITIVWTILVSGGLWYLWSHRQLPLLQIRRLPLVFAAVILLHIYFCAVMIVYSVASLLPCDAQFWIMSIYLPFGIAMLQASNSHFFHVAEQQRKFAQFGDLDDKALHEKSSPVDPSVRGPKRWVEKIRRADKTTRMLIYIGIGMAVQLALTFIIYFGSEMFHSSYGFFNIEVPGTEQRETLCLQGWEWWLSIVWQFGWSWVYAPYKAWKTRNIRDTHGWRVQIIGCCIAGLPASPLWLIGLYTPSWASFNQSWLPPQWFAFSIFFIEIFMVFFPCWQVVKTHHLQQETLDAIASWEKRNQVYIGDEQSVSTAAYGGTTIPGGRSAFAKSGKSRGSTESRDSRKSDTLTMVALESALHNNPQPLLEFAALKDFSGENISFLSHVTDWKRVWATQTGGPDRDRKQFIRAVRIYSHFISMDYSEFPVNISSRAGKELHTIFNKSARRLNSCWNNASDSATPFDDAAGGTQTLSTVPSQNSADLEESLGQANLQSVTRMAELSCDGHIDIPIPGSFDPRVFDVAESEIKYLVLTNTWPKFVNAGFENASQASKRAESAHLFDGARKYFCGLERIV